MGLKITLTGFDGETLVEQSCELESLGSLYAEFGHRPGGYTSQRFLDDVQAFFLRGAALPKIAFEGDRLAG